MILRLYNGDAPDQVLNVVKRGTFVMVLSMSNPQKEPILK